LILSVLISPIQLSADTSSTEKLPTYDPNDPSTYLDIDKNVNRIEDFLDNKLLETYGPDFDESDEYERVIVTTEGRPTSDVLDYFESIGAEVLDIFQYVDAVGIRIPVKNIDLAPFHSTVKMVYGDEVVKNDLRDAIPVVEADPASLQSGGYGNIDGSGVTITVIDSGIDSDHSTFSHNNIIAFRDYVYGNNDLDPTDGMDSYDYADDTNHGTMCAGSAAGNGGGAGYKGAAPGAYLIGIATNTAYDVALAIEWAINNKNRDYNQDGEPDGTDIITLSMGFGGASAMDNYANAAVDNGIVFVTSAGNDGPGTGTISSPATSPKVISVGAINNNKVIADFSSRGPGTGGIIKPEVCAPGVNVVASMFGWWYYASGTSVSSPIAAGVAALLLQYDPTLTPAEVKEILKDSAEDRGPTGPDNTYGWGVIDAVTALDSVLKVREVSASKTDPYEDEEVTFSLTTSGDPSMIVRYDWDFDGDGEYDLETDNPTLVKHKYTKSGLYTVEVKITNTHGKYAKGSIEIGVLNRIPDARINIDNEQNAYFEDEDIIFNASKSWDTDSDINSLKYKWDFTDGNVTDWRSNPTITHGFADNKDYTVKLTVKDDDEDMHSIETDITVVNQQPQAVAGQDRTVYEDDLIWFHGNLSTDSQSDMPLLTYVWDFGDGILGYGETQNHTYKATSANETRIVTLRVIDDDSDESTDSMLVIVLNKPPVVDAGKSKAVNEDDEVEFDGFGNDTISDREDLEYQWDFGDDDQSSWENEPQATHVYTDEGVYIATLSVRDPKDGLNSSSIIVTVTNLAPIAEITVDKKYANEEELISFSADKSRDTKSDTKSLKYAWDFGDNTHAEGKTVKHAYLRSGKYTVNLTVIDDNNAKAKAQINIQVVNIPPQAKIQMDKTEAQVGEVIRFEASKSYDTPSDKANLTYLWDFDTRDNAQEDTVGVTATHKYTKPGEYTIKLKVIDDNGEIDQVTKTITITGSEEKDDDGDMLTSPSIENQGILLYSAIGIIFIIVLFLVLALLLKRKINKPLRKKAEEPPQDQRVGLDQQQQYDPYAMGQLQQIPAPYYPQQQPPQQFGAPPGQQQGGYQAPEGGYPTERPEQTLYQQPPQPQMMPVQQQPQNYLPPGERPPEPEAEAQDEPSEEEKAKLPKF
jgi:subtilisin family serine protease/chitodextrinase